MVNPALQLFLKRLELRSTLSTEAKEALLQLDSAPVVVKAHSDFVKLGQKLSHCVLVASGLVGRFDMLPDGRRQITALHIPGDMCDLPSLVIPKAGWALQALTPSRILRIPHATLGKLAATTPGLIAALWRDTVVDASIFSQGVVNVGRRLALERIAHLWCEMALRFEAVDMGGRDGFNLPMTQSDLADTLGLTVVHVNRTVQILRKTGIVTIRGKRVVINDWDALKSIAVFDPAYLLMERHVSPPPLAA